MSTPYCDIADEDLIALQEGVLVGARAEWVAAHAQSCIYCRRRLADFAETDSLLAIWAKGLNDGDDRIGRVRLRVFAETEVARRARWWPAYRWLRLVRRFPPPWPGRVWAALGLKVVLLVAIGILLRRPDLAPGGAPLRVLLSLVALVLLVTAAIVVQLAAQYDGVMFPSHQTGRRGGTSSYRIRPGEDRLRR